MEGVSGEVEVVDELEGVEEVGELGQVEVVDELGGVEEVGDLGGVQVVGWVELHHMLHRFWCPRSHRRCLHLHLVTGHLG